MSPYHHLLSIVTHNPVNDSRFPSSFRTFLVSFAQIVSIHSHPDKSHFIILIIIFDSPSIQTFRALSIFGSACGLRRSANPEPQYLIECEAQSDPNTGSVGIDMKMAEGVDMKI